VLDVPNAEKNVPGEQIDAFAPQDVAMAVP
jgi:hypothetical protein